MKCANLIFSNHAINQMFKRGINVDDVKYVINNGEVIHSYLDDKPFPSYLILGYKGKPLHVLVAIDENNDKCVIITTYYPDSDIWNKNFKIKL